VEGVNHIKIKLDGNNLAWDIERVVAVDRVLNALDGDGSWLYSLDFNERCPNAEYVLDCFARIGEKASGAFRRIQYVEQPAQRDLGAASPDMRAVARLKPVVIDESLVDYQSLLRARELGYSGVALKACKGQSNALLMAAAARKFGMFLCVQDLTCPGASLLHSAGLAAHIPPITAVESNGRQYVPAANEKWKSRFPGIFQIEGGRMRTGSLKGTGLGIVPPDVRSFHA
jgi:L-alanine-DL-glutamate epimerase-like enolase superfamily enzyme